LPKLFVAFPQAATNFSIYELFQRGANSSPNLHRDPVPSWNAFDIIT